MIPVRLCDIDPTVRLAAARRLARTEADPGKLLDLLQAAARPSSETYWISDDAAQGLPYLMTAAQGGTIGHAAGNGCSRHAGTLPTDPGFLEAA